MAARELRAEMNRRYRILTTLIDAAEEKMAQFPEGSLKIRTRGDIIYYYVRSGSGSGEMLLGKDEIVRARELAGKSYCKKVLKQARIEKDVLERAIRSYPEVPVEEIYMNLPAERRRLIDPIVLPDEEFKREWLSKPFTPKDFREGTPYFETLRGERVRSKSEQIIADRLAANDIPYRYECPLKLGKSVIHPDFTILRMSDRQELYFEHNGRMDDPSYAEDKARRTNLYISNGILPGARLIQLFETRNVPLDVRALDKLINEVFR